MASLSRSVTFGSLATLALGACVAATAVPASAQDGQSIARSWGQGGQEMAGGCWQNQPIFDGMGNFMGFRPIQVC